MSAITFEIPISKLAQAVNMIDILCDGDRDDVSKCPMKPCKDVTTCHINWFVYLLGLKETDVLYKQLMQYPQCSMKYIMSHLDSLKE